MRIDNRLFLCLFLLLLTGTIAGCRSDTEDSKTEGGETAITDKPETPVSAEVRLEAIRLNNVGLAQLENKQWADAEKTLAKLTDTLPRSQVALRNHAICRVLTVIDRTSPFPPTGTAEEVKAFRNACQAAEEASDRFLAVASSDEERSLAELLKGKLLVHISSPERPTFGEGLALLRNAARRQPERPDLQVAVFLAMDSQNEYSDQQKPGYRELLSELEKAFQLAPNNLFVLINVLKRQALGLSSRDEATKSAALKIRETLEAAKPLVATFNESIKKNQRTDLIKLIDDALNSFDESRPVTLMGPGMVTHNLINPELANQVDQRRINRNLLEYIQYRFESKFYDGLPKRGTADTVLKSFEVVADLPDLSGVTSLEVQDMDLDSRDDLVITREGRIEVYSRQSEGWKLLMQSPELPTLLSGLILADLDRDYDASVPTLEAPVLLRDLDGDQKIPKDPVGKNRWFDADLDVVAWGPSGLVILHNVLADDGSRSFVPVRQEMGVTEVNDVAVADVEFDGDLDLIIGTSAGVVFWENRNGSVFRVLPIEGNMPQGSVHSLQIGDFNQDYAIDIAAVVGEGQNAVVGVLENALQGRFRWLANEPQGVSNPLQLPLLAFGVTTSVDPGFTPQGVVAGDFDNDTFVDLLCFSEEQSTLLRGRVDELIPGELPPLSEGMQAASVSDLDDDGDLDIVYVASADNRLKWLRNDGGNTNQWIDLVARAVPDDDQFPANRINMHALGSTAEIRAGRIYQSQVIQAPRIHFGLGQSKTADATRVIWTDGVPQNITTAEILRGKVGLLHPQILKGSCPYIYTWNGTEFVFFSDCLWAAPIGLVQANGEIAPTREWENLLIPGEMLVENDGRYDLQLTEELWEVAYFDHVQLTAIDHPADVAVFTNEKVGPPSLASHRVHTVQRPQLPKSVKDSRGADLLPGLAVLDGDYVQPFQRRILQGLTDEWTMDFELGELPPESADRSIRLFLQGWIFPTDTSLNRHIETNPDLSPPAPPVIEVPDGNGGWRVVRPFIGFPSGKTKAMVIDISDVLADGNSRFRLRSTMELYWDQAFFTVNETDAPTHVQRCNQLSADLHYRGFSRREYSRNALFRFGHAPESYDYSTVREKPRWPEIYGRFTEYGEVSPLTNAHDDQLVVMGPGDELTLSFTVPDKPVPAGWKRDFVLRNVGYDKDADLNTIYGQSSEPFPFRGMSRYPFGSGDQAPDSPEYQRYLEKWQTRESTPGALRRSFRN